MKPVIKKLFVYGLTTSLSLLLLGGVFLLGMYLYLAPDLPEIETLREIKFQEPLRVYSADGKLINEFGQKKRTPLKYDELPPQLINALLAAEDDRFFEHPGVDYKGIMRAVFNLVRTGERSQGGSTITMQVARNFFLSREKTFTRKFNEIFLAFKIEDELTKQAILELYLNKIFFGKRAFGVAAAAQVYYGKNVEELSLPEIAMIVGLPKAPSRYNPVVNKKRATLRRNYVLRRMLELNYISEAEFDQASQVEDNASVHGQPIEVDAPYVAEMVRSEMVSRYGRDYDTQGYKVYTTLDSRQQEAANNALRASLQAYERRHGYRGIIKHVPLYEPPVVPSDDNDETEPDLFADDYLYWDTVLAEQPKQGNLVPAIVIEVQEQSAYAYTLDKTVAFMDWPQLEWARRYIDETHMGPKLDTAGQILKPGDLIYVVKAKRGCSYLAQTPKVSGAFVSLNPNDGSIISLVGGYDFHQSKFNRVLQAKRQPGSSFKPFIYSAAIDKGFTAASIINDAPVVFDAPGLEDTWRPENYTGKWYGDTRLRQALIKSRNLVSIRLLRDIGIGYAIRYITRFGFKRSDIPRDLSLALGSGAITPMNLATGYSVFANSGYKIQPYFIRYIQQSDDTVIYVEQPAVVCKSCDPEPEEDESATGVPADTANSTPAEAAQSSAVTAESNSETAPDTQAPAQTASDSDNTAEQVPEPVIEYSPELLALIENEGPKPRKLAERVISKQTAFLMDTMMRDVIRYGTGRRALVLKRKDMAGKTGTTNDQRDAWFTGFTPNLVSIAWVGFDNPKPLGNRETGAIAALPMWIDYMRVALDGVEEVQLEQPDDIVSVRIDKQTGLAAGPNSTDTMFEFFRSDQIPTDSGNTNRIPTPNDESGGHITEEIF